MNIVITFLKYEDSTDCDFWVKKRGKVNMNCNFCNSLMSQRKQSYLINMINTNRPFNLKKKKKKKLFRLHTPINKAKIYVV